MALSPMLRSGHIRHIADPNPTPLFQPSHLSTPITFLASGTVFTVLSPPTLLVDAQLVAEWSRRAAANLHQYFLPLEPEKLLRDVRGELVLHETRQPGIAEGYALTRTKPLGSARGLHVRIDYFAPSKHTPHSRTEWGFPMDEDYHVATLAHELSIAYLGQVTRHRWYGWQFLGGKSDRPDWFAEGYEGYLALTCSTQRMAGEVLRAAKAKAASEVMNMRTMDDVRPHTHGPTIISYLHETRGTSVVQSILSRRSDRFEHALKSATGFDVPSLLTSWREWLRAYAVPRMA